MKIRVRITNTPHKLFHTFFGPNSSLDNNMTFLNFGKKPTRPTLQFSVQKISKTEDMVLKYDPIKNEKHKEVEYIDIDEKTEFKETFFPLCVNYM